jgi:hypothetical protein
MRLWVRVRVKGQKNIVIQGCPKVALPRKKLNISETARPNELIFFTKDRATLILQIRMNKVSQNSC